MLRPVSLASLLLALCVSTTAQTSTSDIYEEYRAWINSQPASLRQSAEVLDAYRDSLAKKGIPSAEIESRLRLIRTDRQRLETERWNQILTAESPPFNTQPNAFLVEMTRGLVPGQALDIGVGQGRNAMFLAQQGWKVTGFDRAEKAVALAQQRAAAAGVKISTYTQGSEAFDWGENRWDLIVATYEPIREFRDQLIRSLRAGGIVVVEAAHLDANKSGNIDPSVVFDTNELLRLFPGFRILDYEDRLAQADFGPRNAMSRVVRLCAQKQ
jgi:2-polyprenyl-3-methyl-5-hydroxy-6-metoxy-1,4-benzoquinol methylase